MCYTENFNTLLWTISRTIEYYKTLNLTHNISEFIDYAKNDIYAERIKKQILSFSASSYNI